MLIDRDAFTQVLGAPLEQEPELADELIAIFLGKTPAVITALESSIAMGTLAAVYDWAYWLKGACANLGLLPLRACCLRLETCVTAGDAGVIACTYTDVQVTYQATVTALNELRHTLHIPHDTRDA